MTIHVLDAESGLCQPEMVYAAGLALAPVEVIKVACIQSPEMRCVRELQLLPHKHGERPL